MHSDSKLLIYSSAGIVIPSTAATISALSSLLVISIILRSRQVGQRWLVDHTSYYIIMLMMSSGDVLSSLAIALTTVPMPSDVHQTYPYAGKALGNMGTCVAQGSAIMFGGGIAMSSNCILSVYYVLTMRYHVAPVTFRRKVLPALYTVSIIIYLLLSIGLAFNGNMFPVPRHPFCFATKSFPLGCDEEDENSVQICETDHNKTTARVLEYIIIAIIPLQWFIILISLVLVIVTVYSNERSKKEELKIDIKKSCHGINSKESKDEDKDQSLSDNSSIHSHDDGTSTRRVMCQALLYIFALLLCWIWYPILHILPPKDYPKSYQILDPLRLLFMPSQGFINALIFLYYQLDRLRQSERTELGFYQALRKVIVSPHEVPEVFLSRVDTVAIDHLKRENQRRIEEMMGERSACDDNAGLSFRERSEWDDNAGLSFREGSEEQDPTGAIAPASIPSSFESLKTPSVDYSKILSENSLSMPDDTLSHHKTYRQQAKILRVSVMANMTAAYKRGEYDE